jgi:hypothetical protein
MLSPGPESRFPARDELVLQRSNLEMVGSAIVAGSELQQLPSRAGEATLAGQFAEPVRHFSIVQRPVKERGGVQWLVHW